MKKKFIIISIYLVYFSLIVYFGIEARKFGILNSFDFILNYFDSYKKYLFINSMIIVIIIFCNTISYLKAEIFGRIKENIFCFVLKGSIRAALLYEIFTIFSIVLISIIFDFDNPIATFNFSFFIRSLSFFIYNIMLYDVLYIFINKKILSLAIVLSINFLILIGIININYFIFINNLNQEFLTNILFIYNIILIIILLIIFYYKSNNKELLKNEK